jgi:hypothetical protein
LTKRCRIDLSAFTPRGRNGDEELAFGLAGPLPLPGILAADLAG